MLAVVADVVVLACTFFDVQHISFAMFHIPVYFITSLCTSHCTLGVAVGAIAGHAAATVIAILGGTLASQYISEKTISIVGGICFLLFAGLTVFHIF